MYLKPVIVTSLWLLTLSQDSSTPENPCKGQRTCGECIAIHKDCAWCKAPNYDDNNEPRCDLQTEKFILNCPWEHLISPDSYLNKTKNIPPKDGTKTENPIQLQPQVIHLKIRPHHEQRFTLTYRLANHYPVDLYYLMDLSYSMKIHKEKLATLGIKIAKEMNTITQNFRLGFGSFVDKVVMPYICVSKNNTSGIHCPKNVGEDLDLTHGFKNRLSLNDDPEEFQRRVRAARMSGNLDFPEGGLDAVMQAITCENEIGWRNPSRRMLLYSTDAGFHIAGDGKFGGIIKPNDGKCHLVHNIYTENVKQDYPSISQIAARIEEKNVNLIFVVTEDRFKSYYQLKNVIPGAETGILATDSANVVDLIRDNYNKITSKLEMTTVGETRGVDVDFYSRCKDPNGNETRTNVCDGLKVGDSVTFDVRINVKRCRKGTTGYSNTFYIKPLGLPDKLQVNMEVLCECDCENDANKEQNKQSKYCNYHGTYYCGTCDCDRKYYGKACDCFSGNDTTKDLEEQCIAPNSTLICSGKSRGQCVCGTCECKNRRERTSERYRGRWCECDPYSCPFYKNSICGGPSHGVCDCGECICNPDYKGDNCNCSTRNESCIASDGSLCGGPERGQCICNKCECKKDSKYQGSTCEDCKDCKMICRQNKACVQCVAYNGGELKDNCEECKAADYISVEDVLPDGYNSCEFKDEFDCIYFFTYNYDDNNELKIIAKKLKECPKEVNILFIILGVVIGVVVVGLALLLIWKLYTSISDRRELARFESETKEAKWDTGENPVYKPATSTYQNPTYSGTQKSPDDETK